ncbi:ATP-dependent DNA helicase recG domain protein [Mycobacterium xenopi 4042]|uniref:ATP-dependent DNA helicase recG domain protein n=1 Tax=Mycobacterium xenopi 4042 TaxID=1299334 RepID=X8DE23_MYCXE|nr:ATP-dependent DNA helicase recG domain protein [Mycobacterium xenopi 4042]
MAQELLQQLPFELTVGQREVLEVLRRELAATRPMNRLLQGEVGSGKRSWRSWPCCRWSTPDTSAHCWHRQKYLQHNMFYR